MTAERDNLVPGPVRVPKTAELVAEHIRRLIVRGEISEGESLPTETELRAQFGVSRPILREAYRVLEAESLITVRRGARGGAVVRLPGPEVAGTYVGLLLQSNDVTLDDVFRARMVIGPAAVRMAAERRDPEAIAELRAALEAERAAVGEPQVYGVVGGDFHHALVRASGNKTLLVLADMLVSIVRITTTHFYNYKMTDATRRDFSRHSLDAHTVLVDMVEAGRAADAETFWRSHLESLRTRFLGAYGETTVVDLFQ
ncbi:MAG: FCD domain-containing protein [Ilumatobacteraceae bacterium]